MARSSIDPTDALYDHLQRIRETIAAACAQAGRREEDVALLAVTKTVDPVRINRALELGVQQIGENRVQEFLSKRDELHLEGKAVHLIGHLQTNKVKSIVGKVQMIESIDSLRVAQAVDAASRACGIVTDVLVEVNIGGEEAKSGVSPQELDSLLEDLSSLSGIRVRGLMTVPPILETEVEKRQIFSQMYQLFIDRKAENRDNRHMDVLSMGMSGDYREAILEGSTQVRVGSALFGARAYPPTR